MYPFLVNFCIWIDVGIQILSLQVENPVVAVPFVGEIVLSPLNGLGTLFKNQLAREFPGGPVVKTPRSQCSGAQVQSLVGELRSHMLHGVAKK